MNLIKESLLKWIFGKHPDLWWAEMRDRSRGLPLLWGYIAILGLSTVMIYLIILAITFTIYSNFAWLVCTPPTIIIFTVGIWFYRRMKRLPANSMRPVVFQSPVQQIQTVETPSQSVVVNTRKKKRSPATPAANKTTDLRSR